MTQSVASTAAVASVVEDDSELQVRIDAELVKTLYANASKMVLLAMGEAVLLGACVLATTRALVPLWWVGAVLAIGAMRLWLVRRFEQRAPEGRAALPWRRYFTWHATAYGVVWGASTTFLWSNHTLTQTIVTLGLCGMFISSVMALAPHIPTWIGFAGPFAAGVIGRFIADGSTVMHIYAATNVLFVVAGVVLVRRVHGMMRETVAARFENARLLEEARRGKELADHANLAKTKFLAAASHDLRQPLHAVRLFVSALQGCQNDSEREKLLPKLDAATDALGSLLDSLLDLSRAEAGVLQPARRAFSAQSVLDTIEREWAGAAEAKGLSLRVAPCGAWLQSDPELVTTIIRNFVANAVRYTDSGSILLGCRRRGGEVLLSVWDTGPGIAAEHQREIFREFHQLANPARDREQGLGLGLAIVERLARLLQHEVLLESQPGSGSCFALRVPRTERAPAAEPAQARPAALNDLRIAIIDDDRSVLEASVALLRSWGAAPIAFDDPDEAFRALTSAGVPDVVVVDLRLPGPRNGIAWVEDFRTSHALHVPAIIVTGDTAPAELVDAYQRGITVLHKPVRSAQLRKALERYASS